MRILIVEDDKTSQIVLENILNGYGTCSIAIDGETAIDEFSRAADAGEPYDLICMDIMMPGMDGITALTKIRELEQDISETDRVKVIITSAVDDSKTMSESFYRCGASSYIVKPVTPEILLEDMQRLNLV